MINVAIAEPGAQGSSEKKETKATRAQTLSPALQQLNASMHLALGQAVTLERRALGPLIMFEAGEIKLYRGDQEVAREQASLQ